MEEIIARQNAAAKPLTGKQFLLGVASIILRLSIAQMLVNLAITLTGMGLLNVVFYLYAVLLLLGFMTRTVAGNIYTLKEKSLLLQRMLGDSTITLVEIPTEAIVSIRPIVCGENLGIDYRQVTYIDPACKPSARMRAAFFLSLIWAWAARKIAGRQATRDNGVVVVYDEGGMRRACVFSPDEAFCGALHAAFAQVYGEDDRAFRQKLTSYYARSLRRAFGGLYPQVLDMVSPEEIAWADEEIARRRVERYEAAVKKKAERKKITIQESRAQMEEEKRKTQEAIQKGRQLAQKGVDAVKAAPEKAIEIVTRIRREAEETDDFIGEDEAEEARQDDDLSGDLYIETREEADGEESGAHRRRRNRQE